MYSELRKILNILYKKIGGKLLKNEQVFIKRELHVQRLRPPVFKLVPKKINIQFDK